MKRAAKSKQPVPKAPAAAPSLLTKLPAFFVAALTVLCVIAPLLPLDTAAGHWNNVLPLMLSLLLLGAWVLAGFARGELAIKWDGATIAILVLTALPLVSAANVIIGGTGNARLAANLSWQWLGFGVLFFYARQVLRNAADVRMLAAVMLAVTTGLALFALAQYAYLMPQARAEYALDPEAKLAEAQIHAPPGTPERRHFEDRLASTEPTATFALTNSLAGLLAPWLVLCFGLLVAAIVRRSSHTSPTRERGDAPPREEPSLTRRASGEDPSLTRRASVTILTLVAIFLLLFATLVLTKSRTATLAFVLGAGLALVYLTPLGKRIDVRIPVGLGLAGALVLIVGTVSGGLDTQVLSEAPKSVLYRFQYWQATAAMIAEHPWLGCGPGNFQDAYLQYQLPEASENIADPHNFVLEIWATSGTLAALALAAAAILLVWRVRQAALQPASTTAATLTATWTVQFAALLMGVALAYGLGLVAGYMPDVNLLLALPLVLLVFWLLRSWIASGEITLAHVVTALVALLVNLLAAGGISFPGVASSVWVLIAMVLVLCDGRSAPLVWRLPRTPAALILLAVLLVGVAFHRMVYLPVLESSALQAQAEDASAAGRMTDALEFLNQATKVDPYAPRPWMSQAALWHAGLIQAGESPAARSHFDQATEQALLRDPRSASTLQQLGNWRLELYRRLGHAEDLAAALYNYRGVVARYPNSARGYAQLAWALHLAGNAEEAGEAAKRALELDSQHNHGEYKLKALRLVDFPPAAKLEQPPVPSGDSEQIMQQLRTSSTP